MKNIALVFGGRSPEHEVSIISAKNILNAFDKSKFNIELIYINKNGNWFWVENDLLLHENFIENYSEKAKSLVLIPFDNQPLRINNQEQSPILVDVFFPITHGVLGEDGCIQGVFEHLHKPYVGPSVLGSSIGMDKDVAKIILAQNDINVTPWLTYFKNDEINFNEIENKLGYPCFVKPANMGSGVGVQKAENIDELKNAINQAFDFDIKIIIEKGINGREIETAVIGNLNPKATGIGEIIVTSGFYTYENKYINPETRVDIPILNFEQENVEIIKNVALRAYRCLQLQGLSRVDFFYVSPNEFYLNEVNTLPGFTSISMYPKLWEQEGLKYSDLLESLIAYAIERYDMINSLKKVL